MSENEGVDKLRENAAYLGRMALELARLAQRSNFHVLVYLFNMAAEEAASLLAELGRREKRNRLRAARRAQRVLPTVRHWQKATRALRKGTKTGRS